MIFLSTGKNTDVSLTLNDLFDYYRNVYVPAYADAVVCYGGKPQQILIETENTFAHLAQYFDPNLDIDTQKSNLHKAYSHLVRVTLDCYKLVWLKVNEDLMKIYNNIDTDIYYINVSKEKFITDYRLYTIKSEFARIRELQCIGINPLESVELYKEAISMGQNLIGYIDGDKKQKFSRFRQIIKTKEFIFSTVVSFVLGLLTNYFWSIISKN